MCGIVVPGTVLVCSIPGGLHYGGTPLVRLRNRASVCVTGRAEETLWCRGVARRDLKGMKNGEEQF